MQLWNSYVNLIEWFLQEIAAWTGNFGLAIIIFTILLKTVLLPLTVKSIRSTAAMQELQPKIKELQKKYSKDRQKLSQETMRLYQEYRINPAAGCLPMILQIPIFLGLYRAVVHLSGNYGGFLWMNDLSSADPYKILPVVAGVFQFLQTKMMRPHNGPKITDPQQQMMNTMMNFMPLMVVVFGWSFAAGPVLYWATQSVYSVVQQWLITGWGSLKDWAPMLPDLPEHRRLGHRKEGLQRVELDAAAEPKGLFARMQRSMEQQQSRREQALDTRARSTDVKASEGASSAGKRGKRARAAVPAEPTVSGGSDGDGARASRPKTVPRRDRGGGSASNSGGSGGNKLQPDAGSDRSTGGQ